MTNEQMLLNAAKAMRFSRCGFLWNPLESSADCAEIEDALDVDVDRGDDWVRCWIGSDSHVVTYADHPNKGAARRYASTMVASLVGEKL